MSSNIHGINFDNQTVTAKDHGHLFQCVIEDGILSGCGLSFSGTSLVIAPGYFLVAGREMKLTANTNVTIAGATSGFARVLLTIDLSKVATEELFEQANFELQYANSVAAFPELNQEEVNSTGTVYQFPLCVVSLGTSGIAAIESSAGAAAVRIPLIVADMIASAAVTTGKIASGAVTSGKIGTGAVGTEKLADSAVTAAKIANGAVGSDELAAGAVTSAKLGDASVSAAKLGAASVETAKIADGAITTAKLASAAVTIAKGGTGSSNGSTGLKNLLAAGNMILSSYQYGTALPAAGTAGRLFFKKV